MNSIHKNIWPEVNLRSDQNTNFFDKVDDFLDDLDKDVSQEEVDRLIAYEKGEAMRIHIVKLDGTTFCKESA